MKKIMLFLLTTIIASTVYGDDKNGFKTSPTGVNYKVIVANPEGRPVLENTVITLTSSLYINDSLVSENTEPMPLVQQAPQRPGDLFDALALMHEGETMEFTFEPKVYIGDEIPPFIKETDAINMTVSVVKVQTVEEFETEQAAVKAKLMAEEKAVLQEYIKENKIKATETPSGLFIAITQEGTGEKPEPGAMVSVHYTGKLLNGKVFDSSIERGAPIQFNVGIGKVIRGWDEGILTMKVGEKAIFLIPSDMAYGSRDMGAIPPNSPLVFEVELLEIK